jgi:hypothetical protein
MDGKFDSFSSESVCLISMRFVGVEELGIVILLNLLCLMLISIKSIHSFPQFFVVP